MFEWISVKQQLLRRTTARHRLHLPATAKPSVVYHQPVLTNLVSLYYFFDFKFDALSLSHPSDLAHYARLAFFATFKSGWDDFLLLYLHSIFAATRSLLSTLCPYGYYVNLYLL